ncbi:MAG: DUF2249 domain-containing protein [Actinomycetota bacterium]|nr:MAG: DUF2249 domain-containing protein [Actinomycetota bacterium]
MACRLILVDTRKIVNLVKGSGDGGTLVATLDARPIIAAGEEPFDQIMATVAGLTENEELVIIAPFEPVPLEGVLSSQGFTYDAVDIGNGDWQVTFRR